MYRGVTTIDVSLNSLDIQQCDLSGEDQGGVFDPFVGTHRCKNTTTVSKTTTTTDMILIVVPIFNCRSHTAYEFKYAYERLLLW